MTTCLVRFFLFGEHIVVVKIEIPSKFVDDFFFVVVRGLFFFVVVVVVVFFKVTDDWFACLRIIGE